MAYTLPIDRSVSVTVSREDNFPTTAGFNTALLLVPTALDGKLTAAIRTRLYSNMTEVAFDWLTSSQPYKAAQRFFSAKVRPPQLKMGYQNPANDITAELDAIYGYDSDWFWGLHTNELNDSPKQRDIAAWAETKEVLFGFDSNDTDTESAAVADDATFPVTVTIANPAVFTKTAHGLAMGDLVRFTTSGALPTGIDPATVYYVASATANTFTISETVGGPTVATSGTQSGVHTATAPKFGGSLAEYLESRSYDRSAVFYHTDPNSYFAAGAWGYTSGRNFDRANFQLASAGRIDSGQAYTLKFKTLPGVEPINKASTVVQAITGFVPAIGNNKAQGHSANAYVNMGGRNIVTEGTVASGAFIDEIHFTSWIKARVQESVFGVKANNARIPYTNQGVGFLIEAGINPPFRVAFGAGLIAPREDDDGQLVPAFQVAVDDVANVPVAQRRNRIAPDIKVDFIYAGAIHFTSISMTFKY